MKKFKLFTELEKNNQFSSLIWKIMLKYIFDSNFFALLILLMQSKFFMTILFS